MAIRRKLSDSFVATAAAPASGRALIYDAVIAGLALSVTHRGAKTYVLHTRFLGVPSRAALRHDDGRTVTTVADARAVARSWLDQLAQGRDPRPKAQKAKAADPAVLTFGAVAELFITSRVRKQRRGRLTEREIRNELVARWGDRPLANITRADVVAMTDEIAGRGATRQAHNIFGLARTLFNWAVERYGIASSPCDRIKLARLIGSKKIRQRVLSDDELFAAWRASGKIGYPYGPVVRLLMITGCRLSEVANARWREFDKKVWTIPAERFKSDSTHLVPLTKPARDLLDGLPRWTASDLLFSYSGTKSLNSFSSAKARLDRRMLRTLKALARRRCDDHRNVKLEPWVFHDLRRTVRTRLSALRVPSDVAEQVIGHGKRGLARVYDQHQYEPEVREALVAWVVKLGQICEPREATAKAEVLA